MKILKDNAMMQEMSLQDMKDVNGGSVGGLLKEVGKWLLSSMAWDLVKEQKNSYELCGPMGDYMDSCQNAGFKSII